MTIYLCLHCNYKEYRQECLSEKGAGATTGTTTPTAIKDGKLMLEATSGSNSNIEMPTSDSATTVGCSSSSSSTCCASGLTAEEKLLQAHMTDCHSIDFNQILQQHQQLQTDAQSASSSMIESTPMNDMYLSVQLKSLKYIDDELLRRDEFKLDMLYSCPICAGDVGVHNASHLNPLLASSASSSSTSSANSTYSQYESVTFDYLINHFLTLHQLKAVPLYVCTLCNCVRVSLIDCVYHFVRYHFNKRIVVGICAYNIYDKIAQQLSLLTTGATTTVQLTQSKKSAAAAAAAAAAVATAAAVNVAPSVNPSTQILPVSATLTNTVYGSGPLVYCNWCNENYSNEHAFIRHSFLAHLLDPNVNLNWFKVRFHFFSQPF